MDTSIGIDNKGKLVFDYNLEDTDQINNSDVYNGQDSVFWNNIRDAFPGEIAELYSTLRTQKLISYEHVNQMFLDHQGKWTESIFNEDAKVKYVRPLAEGKNYLEMLQGSKAQQRMWWLYNRFRYMDSKYNTGDAKLDYIQFRAYVDENIEKPNITITPYADIYATVSFANSKVGTKAKRAKRNEPITLENPFKFNEKETDQETYIYSASQLKSIGDISPFYPDTVDVGNAIKLQDLKIGSGAEGYVNPNLTSLALGSNTLLRTLDVRNCVNLTQSIDITKCINIEEVYFSGTKITGIMLPDGGNIKKLYLPNTLTKLTLKNQPLLEDLQLAGTENMESLWLENIPATSIKSYEMVDKLKSNSAVRIIGMNETYQNWEEIEAFYNKLDTMKGLDSVGEVVDKAQVTGTIHIEHVPYERYQDYVARYPEVFIDTKSIVCKVTFMNENSVHTVQQVGQGFLPTRPEIPQKTPTQQNYWTFNRWVYEDGETWDETAQISQNTTLYAVYNEYVQQYTVSYNVDSIVISVEPQTVTDYYGATILAPVCNNIPEGVELLGWFAPDGSRWNFEGEENATQLFDNVVLIARWSDSNTPIVWATRKDYKTFTYAAQDNLGIVGWQVTRNDETTPTYWNEVECTTEVQGEYEISAPGTYRIWVTDRNKNTASASIIAYPISRDLATGVVSILINEQTEELTDFALVGTTVNITATLDDHYKGLGVFVNEEAFVNGDVFVVDQSLVVTTTCTPKDYTVTFVTSKETEGLSVDPQVITYLHRATRPFSFYHKGYIINNWYRDPELTVLWDFEEDKVENDTTLYAEWCEYRTPTKIQVTIPFDPNAASYMVTSDPYTIEVNYFQNRANDVKVYFGDDTGEHSSNNVTKAASIVHTYSEPGTYTIEIWGTPHGYYLGNSYTKQTIVPACCINDIEFAWDVTTTQAHAFKGAGITELKLTSYMDTIAESAFEACKNLTSLTIPANIKTIGNYAFKDCTAIAGTVVIPKTLESAGIYAFYGCTSMTNLIFEEDGALRQISDYFANNSGIKQLDIPGHIDYLGKAAFGNCRYLEKVILRNPNLQMGDQVFNSTIKLNTAGPIGDSDADYDIEFAWKTKIPDNAFSAGTIFRQSYLQTVVLPDSLEEIGHNAFRGSAIQEIKLPTNKPITIGDNAFYFTNLLTINVPSNVISLGSCVFGKCRSLSIAVLNIEGSLQKANLPEQGWFYECNGGLVPQIPKWLADDPYSLFELYGNCWHVYNQDKSTFEIFTLEYSSILQN
jgi:hypothetical protein